LHYLVIQVQKLMKQPFFGKRFTRSFNSAWWNCSYNVHCSYYILEHQLVKRFSENSNRFTQFKGLKTKWTIARRYIVLSNVYDIFQFFLVPICSLRCLLSRILKRSMRITIFRLMLMILGDTLV
jgi:hypothetical protein